MRTSSLLILLFISFLTGCAGLKKQTTHYPDDTSLVSKCNKAYFLITKVINNAAVSDAETHPVQDFPYLRSNRFLASLKSNLNSNDEVSAWLDQLIRLDQHAKLIETRNLPKQKAESTEIEIKKQTGENWTIDYVINNCPAEFKKFDLVKSETIERIKRKATVPDDYSLLKRTFGLYPLTKYAVYHGHQQWKKNNLVTFTHPEYINNWQGTPVLYKPDVGSSLTSSAIARMIKTSRDIDLNMPVLTEVQIKQLAEQFAPVFLIDEVNNADKIGQPVWSDNIQPEINLSQPVSFVRVAYTWFNGSILPQLIYTIWFPERPKRSAWDILGGKIDGITWRVTIDNDGTILAADTIHPCGCYHLFFPAQGTYKRQTPLRQAGLSEAIETPKNLPAHTANNRITLRLATDTHYLQTLLTESETTSFQNSHTYQLIIDHPIPEFTLRSMPLPKGGFKSLYNTEGIVQGTERAERWLLWPMGIKSPGAMRQWGKHATAFVGRRHFDDPFLFDRAFIKEN